MNMLVEHQEYGATMDSAPLEDKNEERGNQAASAKRRSAFDMDRI